MFLEDYLLLKKCDLELRIYNEKGAEIGCYYSADDVSPAYMFKRIVKVVNDRDSARKEHIYIEI